MNQSLLQKAFGVSWHYRCVRVDYHWGAVQFHLDLRACAKINSDLFSAILCNSKREESNVDRG